jgi:replicative DNA helicase
MNNGHYRRDLALERGLPTSLDAERLVLGSILLDDASFDAAAGTLRPDDFSLEKHRRIFQRMVDLRGRGERIDRVTVIEELQRHNQLESCDGMSYICSLDDGMPRLIRCHSYVGIVKEKALLRRTIFTAQQVMNRCFLQEGSSQEILAGAGDLLGPLGARCRAQADASRERRPGEIQISGGQCRRAAGLAFSFIRTGCSPAHLPFCLLALAWPNQKV